MAEPFKQGAFVYSRSGYKFQVEGYTTDGRIITQQIVEVEGYDGGTEEYPSGEARLFNVADVFAAPPKAAIDAEITAKNAELSALRAELAETQAMLKAQDGEHQVRLAKIRRHEALARIEDFIDGRMTHVVLGPGYGGRLEVKPFEALREKDGHGRTKGDIKLLSLFGRSNGDLLWRVNQYYDGSGCWEDCVPCASMEEAKAAAAKLFEGVWDAYRADDRFPTYAFDCAAELGIPIPADIQAKRQNALIAGADKSVADAKEKLAAAEAKAAEARGMVTA